MPLEYKGSLSRYRRYLQTIKSQPLVRASIWVIFSLVLTIVMILTALKPTLSTIAALIGQIEQQKAISAQLDEKIRTVQTATRNYEKVRPQINLLNEAMPDLPEWKVLALRLETEATGSGISLNNLIIRDIPVKGKYVIDKPQVTTETTDKLPAGMQKLEINLQATGQYNQIIEFLSRMQNLRRLIVLTNIDINKNEKGELSLSAKGYAIFSDIKAVAL